MDKIILSIDCGTQSLRAMLFNQTGELLGKAKIDYEPYYSSALGWAEQDAEIFWSALCEACMALRKSRTALWQNIAGVGVTSQRDTLVNVDRDGNALRPAILWLDQRKAETVYRPKGFFLLAYFLSGMLEPVYKTQADGKCSWIRQYQPDIWNKTYKYLQIASFLNFRLTGNFKDSAASQIGHTPFEYKKRRWAKKNSLMYKIFPVEEDKLVEITEPGTGIGKITQKASMETGIPVGTIVIACGSDKGCETVGTGCIGPGKASLSFGTTATVQTTFKRYTEPIRFMPSYPAPIPAMFNPEVEIFRGYWMISWFKKEFGYPEKIQAEKEGLEPEIILNRLLGKVPPGSLGLTLQPYWSPGLKMPAAKGCMVGFGEAHTKAHIYRAVIEGLGYALYSGLRKIEKATGVKAGKISVSGGGSQSDEVCQITADIFNRTLVRGSTHEAAGLGAAVITAVGIGIYPGFDDAVREMVRYEKEFVPNRKNAEIYSKLYKRVYSRLYGKLKPLYDEIRDITGYPEKI